MENVKEKILLFVQSIGLSKAEIARQLGISKSNFAGEAMASDLNVSMVIKFCQLYPQVSAEWLLRGEGEMLRNADKSTEVNIKNTNHMGHHNNMGHHNSMNIGCATQAISPADYAHLQQQVEELKADKEKLYQLLLKQ